MAEQITLSDSDEESSGLTVSESDGGLCLNDGSKRFFGLPDSGYSLLQGLDWSDSMDDWKDFICSLKRLSDT